MRAFRAAAMLTKNSTRVCRRSVVLALTMFALGPREAAAAPLFMGNLGDTCELVPTSPTRDCGLFTIVNPLLSPTVTGTFQADNDVALFQFTLFEASSVTVFTTGAATIDEGLDPLIGLFHETGSIVRYDIEPGVQTDAENDDAGDGDFNAALPAILLERGTYLVAMLQTFNNFSSGLGIHRHPSRRFQRRRCSQLHEQRCLRSWTVQFFTDL